MSLFEVSIMTPDAILFSSKEVKEVVLPTTTGRMGILANHAPLVTGLDIGVMLISDSNDSNWTSVALLGGFALMKDNKVRIVVSEAKFGRDIDRQEAETVFLKAQEDLAKVEGKKEKIESTLALKRARARYEACQ
jgi:ATP synthase F1 epsilon subunit